jgi:uncharacterized protein (PEP-CTERM system associated)
MVFDREKLLRPLPRSAKRALLATASIVIASHAIALAQEDDTGPKAPLRFRNDYFGYGLAVGPRVSYTDNINLTPTNRDDELAFSMAANGSAIYSTNRFSGIIDGSLDVSYLTDQADIVASQDVGAASTTTIAENWLYFDAAGSTSRQLAGEGARFSQNLNAGRNQRVNVHNFALSPYVNHRFTNGSAAELRYRFSQVFIDANNNNRATFDTDSRTQEVVASYDTGTALDRLQVKLTAYGNRTEDYGSSLVNDFEFEQGTLEGDVQVALTERFALTGAVGYDDVETTAPASFVPASELTGLYWRAGFRARPGRKTDVRLEYGRRYDDDFIDARMRYDVSERVKFFAGAGRSFQTRAQAVSTQFEALQRRTLDFVEDLRAGAEGSGDAESVIDALTRTVRTRLGYQQIGLGVSNDANANLTGDFGRTTLNLYGNYQDTDYGYRRIKYYGGGFGAQRELSRRMSGYANVFYRHVKTNSDLNACLADPTIFRLDPNEPGFDVNVECANVVASDPDSDTVGGRLGIAYRLYQNVSAFGEYSHTERFSPRPDQEYGENAVTLGVQMEF